MRTKEHPAAWATRQAQGGWTLVDILPVDGVGVWFSLTKKD